MKNIFVILWLFILNINNVVNAQIITTIAGGITGHGSFWGDGEPATDASFSFGGFAVDANGDIYI